MPGMWQAGRTQKARQNSHMSGKPSVGQVGSGPECAQTSRTELAGVPGCGLQGLLWTHGAPSMGRGKVEIPSGGNGDCCQPRHVGLSVQGC